MTEIIPIVNPWAALFPSEQLTAVAKHARNTNAQGLLGNVVFNEMEISKLSIQRSEWKFTLFPSPCKMQSHVCLAGCFVGSQPR